MNISVVTLFAAVLCTPVLLGLLDGSVEPDQAGVRVLLAVAFALVIERVVRRFLQAVMPADQPGEAALAAVSDEDGARRRRADG